MLINCPLMSRKLYSCFLEIEKKMKKILNDRSVIIKFYDDVKFLGIVINCKLTLNEQTNNL